MNPPSKEQLTCWALIEHAAAGQTAASDEFARRYAPIVRACLCSRWKQSTLIGMLDDAVQDVLIECFRPNGVLQRADAGHAGGFRPYFYGVVRNVAKRYESKRPTFDLPQEILADETTVGQMFDREFARAVMREASQVQQHLAIKEGPQAVRRFQLLSLRFQHDLPIREIAIQWNVDPAWLHHQYATARAEFRRALMQVIALQHPHETPAEHEKIARGLLDLL